MSKLLLLLLVACSLAACAPRADGPALEEGTWTGGLTPMSHPEMVNPVTYRVRHEGEALAIDLVGPGGAAASTRDVRLTVDTLFFTFDEPEEGVPLRCALGREGAGYAGRCTDPAGKWARFTMRPPEE